MSGRPSLGQALHHGLIRGLGLLLVTGLALGLPLDGGANPLQGTASSHPTDIATVEMGSLPAEARQTERLIRAGGPFSSPRDAVVFGNRERLLPRQPRGFYREYTVPTPGARDRGARRLVCGGLQPRQPEACFYTDDHYASFRRIVP